ncbi:hypothetical protein GF336_06900 [Candidatus Woesearchaeota archaeon]|nr:hypothetical protein [Candidatus Woesearchaeota archaeon]
MRKSIIFSIFALVLMTACTSELECTSDADCVPASCCHADSCVPKDRAPDCSETFCTQECVPETLDCNQGDCICQDNRCTTEFY